ncbi:T9SS type A sorting domain-containing protein [Kaistella palustris]|uniref:T9SS type A sorting domain-containing protein n=1 Tax=Kaistella palustris TaxID=493376 RepID=UPI000A05D0C8|nr:T9SS type A sorting domain-containing protein [Kaistella palustris]
MIKFNLLLLCLAANLGYSQMVNNAKAPNSYIYDIQLAQSNNYGGLEIPVVKAYEMWSKYEYLKTNGSFTPIPPGIQSATLYWEDVPGLVQNVSIVPGGEPSASKIKVEINKGKGKGNAVVAFKVDGMIYWSWHIWVTDNPENGNLFSHGTETDIDGNLFVNKYMDRNLGATTHSFLDDQWQKSGGLMYEWGRKDPFPPLVYKDADFYAISGEVGVLRHKQIDALNTIPVEVRPFNEIEKNIQYSVKNPITYIINTDATGNWFSSNRYKVAGVSPNYITWDLWSDNAKGGNSNGNSSSVPLQKESRSYELKSELDPCPNGWRIPSYLGRETQNNNLAFFGKHDWNNDDIDPAKRQLFPDSQNPNLHGIKVYPGLGMDFTQALAGERNLGILPASGTYVYYPNSAAPNAPVGITFQDNAANGGLWSSTYAYDGARIFSLITDPVRTNTSVGLHAIYINQTNPSKAGNAVRCMKDPNMAKIGDFATQYFASQKENFTAGLDNPNSYVAVNQTHLSIPVSKAFSVYNQLLSDQEMIPSTNLAAKVLWTTQKGLVKNITLNTNSADARLSTIEVELDPNIKGNAVVALSYNSQNSPVLWSWHIWAPDNDPTANPLTYVTEAPIPVTYNFINPTVSKSPTLKTTFMDRNLGAQSSDLTSGRADGLHYQWGRKDPLPTFANASSPLIYIDGSTGSSGVPTYIDVPATKYLTDYTKSYDIYGSANPSERIKVRNNIKYSVENPLKFLYQKGIGTLYDGGNHYANDLSRIRDWASDERGQANNRWGHADKKSPFDPCPEGWRVPDVSFTNLYTGSKGNSPWYNGYRADAYGKQGVIQDQWHDVASFYGGNVAGTNGWKFEDANFRIGDFPRDGIRGELGENTVSYERSGVWTAALADMNTGYALAMQFQGNKMQTGTGVYPQAGMSVRCAKDEKRLLGATVEYPQLGTEGVDPKVTGQARKEIKVYPNPFRDEFEVSNTDAVSYELYDFSGKMLLKGEIINKKINAGKLQNGAYVLKVVLKDGSAFSKKMIKQ